MRIIKDKAIVEDNWLHLDDQDEHVLGDITISVARWQEQSMMLYDYKGHLGIRLSGDDCLESIVKDLDKFSLIALYFPKCTDGRCYSFARLLRERFSFKGEIRARGDVLCDQLFYMMQCGINSFEMGNPNLMAGALAAFDDFSESYQSTVLQPVPLYRRCR